MNQYRCGGCGHGNFKLFEDGADKVQVLCLGCGSISAITFTASLDIQWGDDKRFGECEGRICQPWDEGENIHEERNRIRRNNAEATRQPAHDA